MTKNVSDSSLVKYTIGVAASSLTHGRSHHLITLISLTVGQSTEKSS